MSNFSQESVLSVHHWTDNLFSFTTMRNPSFRFRSGEFTMIGLKVGEKPLLRAYGLARGWTQSLSDWHRRRSCSVSERDQGS
ncbi:hypothetical protein XI09_13020 [Bradyrhizobium sp. CCBAU 11386]|nr:hypothetical protein [Bradyrhizobium sp. CCBAU 11386]